ncbi:WD40 repeat domain-containing protein [Rhodopirellula bahusiensis]|uniref:Uncharacterized protein n=1 Tax=Rhodopirellula bahusiensis TaxID=2014065 RepID=A0A2G1WCK2_9BACT|nr:DUF4034 domain-containing protein [Rhodopirellula bahusiensis]PHQ36560.1 hypothetical protein CEE69_04080 [Rhodopirellula bahusiensis]
MKSARIKPFHLTAFSWLLLAIVCNHPSPVNAQHEFDSDIEELLAEVNSHLMNREYVELNQLIDKTREQNPYSINGTPLLTAIYEHLGSPIRTTRQTVVSVNDRKQVLNAWISSEPSVGAYVAMADCMLTLAFRHRGGGFASTIPPSRLAPMHEALEQAEAALDQAEAYATDGDIADAGIPLYRMRVARLTGADRETMQRYLNESAEIDPWLQPPIGAMCQYLQPRWYGEEGDLLAFAENWSDEMASQTGDYPYAMVAWNTFNSKDATHFSEDGFQWPRMKRGVLQWLEQVPDSPMRLGGIAYFAHLAGDRETARAMIERLEGRWITGTWPDFASHERTVRWAFDTDSLGDSLLVAELGPKRITKVSLLDEGQRFIAFNRNRKATEIIAYDTETGNESYRTPVWPENLSFVSDQPVGDSIDIGMQIRGRTTILRGDPETLDFATIGQSDGYIQSLTTTEDGKVVAMSDSGGNIKFWLIEDAPIPHEWKDALPNGTSTLALSPNGDRIFAGCDQSLRMWSTETRQLVHTFTTNTPRIHSVDWSSDGKLLAAAGAGNKIELWNAEDFSKLGEIELSAEFITSIEISPDGRQLAAGTWSASVPTKPGEVILCDIEGQYVLKTLHGHRMNVHDVTFTPDGSKILSASDDGSVRIWDASQD